jgi:hypothetical protein
MEIMHTGGTMTRMMRHCARRVLHLLALGATVAAGMLASACSLSSGGGSSSEPQRAASVVAIDSGMVVMPAQTANLVVRATCPSGTTLLSGGYAFSAASPVATSGPDDSYPSSTSTWTVAVHAAYPTSADIKVEAFATCLRATVPVTTHIVQRTATQEWSADDYGQAAAPCPSGSMLTGGGFQGGAGASHSVGARPRDNQWQILEAPVGLGESITESAYAVCVSAPLRLASIMLQSSTVPQEQEGSGTADCAQGQLAAGGGFDFVTVGSDRGMNVTTSAPVSSNTESAALGWQVTAYDYGVGAQVLTVYVICVAL